MLRRLLVGAALPALILLSVACGQSSATGGGANPTASDPAGVAPVGGDIPDNVTWLTYKGPGFSIQYPEGWVLDPKSDGVSFTDKESRISATIRNGSTPTLSSAAADVAAISGASVTAGAHEVSLPAGTAIVLTYEIDGSRDPVTGKRPRLTIDRYELGSGGKVAVLELGAQIGVDNRDAYLTIAKSLAWS